MLRAHELDATIDEVLRGDRNAFREILHAYGLPLRTYVAAWVHHIDDIDDLAQEVFLAAFRNLGDFRRGDDFGAWLRGIARNKIYHHFRNSSRRNWAMERFREDVAGVVGDKLERAVAVDDSKAIEVLLHCIGQLPERMRRAVRAGLDGSKPADLAAELMTTVNAVYVLHHRANQLLRDRVRKELG